MTLTPGRDKKDTVVDFSATDEERKVFADALDQLSAKMVLDYMNPEEPLRIGSVTNPRISLGKKGALQDPLYYIKIKNALARLALALRTNVASTEISMEPNELTRDTGDPDAAIRVNNDMHSLLGELKNKITKVDVDTLGRVRSRGPDINPGTYIADFVYDMTSLESNLRGGEKLEELLRAGQVIPEYGETQIPPVQRGLLSSSRRGLANQLIVVGIKDNNDLSIAVPPEDNVFVDKKKFMKVVKGEEPLGSRITHLHLNNYREEGFSSAPKTVGELLGMATTLAAAKEYGMIAPKLAMRPMYTNMVDPSDGKEKQYFIYVIAGYNPSSRRVSSGQQALAESKGIETLLG